MAVALAAGRRNDRRAVITPQPAQRIGQDGRALLHIVLLGPDYELGIVARILERHRDILIGHKPTAGVNVLVVAAVLLENTQRLGRSEEHTSELQSLRHL